MFNSGRRTQLIAECTTYCGLLRKVVQEAYKNQKADTTRMTCTIMPGGDSLTKVTNAGSYPYKDQPSAEMYTHM